MYDIYLFYHEFIISYLVTSFELENVIFMFIFICSFVVFDYSVAAASAVCCSLVMELSVKLNRKITIHVKPRENQ